MAENDSVSDGLLDFLIEVENRIMRFKAREEALAKREEELSGTIPLSRGLRVDMLTGRLEIARFHGVDYADIKRWEVEFGYPIVRMPPAKQHGSWEYCAWLGDAREWELKNIDLVNECREYRQKGLRKPRGSSSRALEA